jgi:hypothetical protein
MCWRMLPCLPHRGRAECLSALCVPSGVSSDVSTSTRRRCCPNPRWFTLIAVHRLCPFCCTPYAWRDCRVPAACVLALHKITSPPVRVQSNQNRTSRRRRDSGASRRAWGGPARQASQKVEKAGARCASFLSKHASLAGSSRHGLLVNRRCHHRNLFSLRLSPRALRPPARSPHLRGGVALVGSGERAGVRVCTWLSCAL